MTVTPNPETYNAEIKARLRSAMNAATGLTPDEIDSLNDLIRAGEELVAFEMLCTQIYEWSIPLPPAVIRDLQQLGATLGADPSDADDLWKNVKDA